MRKNINVEIFERRANLSDTYTVHVEPLDDPVSLGTTRKAINITIFKRHLKRPSPTIYSDKDDLTTIMAKCQTNKEILSVETYRRDSHIESICDQILPHVFYNIKLE